MLLTDHDTLAAKRAGEEGWHGSVLVLVGEEITPPDRDHFLAFGVEKEIPRRQPPGDICASVARAGGFGFAAHPFSQGSERFRRARGMPWTDLDCDGLEGVELWSFVTDTAERLGSIPDMLRFIAMPGRTLDHPPERNLAEWDRLCRRRRVVGIAGIDAHQIGIRVRGHVPLRLMSYARSFRHLRTHVLCDEPPNGELSHDRDQVYAALRAGRCYMSVDSACVGSRLQLRRRRGGDGRRGRIRGADRASHHPAPRRAAAASQTARKSPPRAARSSSTVPTERRASYRIEARLAAHRRERTWILSNPVYLRVT